MKKYEEQIINYLIGGIIPLIVLVPFVCTMFSELYRHLFDTRMQSFLVSILSFSSIFILFTIALGAVSSRMKAEGMKILESVVFYFKLVPLVSFFLLVSILIGFNLSILYSCIISCIVYVIIFLLTRKLQK